MSLSLALLLAAVDAPAEPPRAIAGALGVSIGEIATDAQLRGRGFTRVEDSQLWRRETAEHFPVVRVGRSLSGRVLNVVMERRWAEEEGLAACQSEQQAFAQVIHAVRPELVREEIGPKDILFVRLHETGPASQARAIEIVCSFIPTRVPPTLRIVWDVSPAERAAAYAEPATAESASGSE